MTTHITHIKFGEWFPTDHPVSTALARLTILREDLYLELKGQLEKPIPDLDEHSMDWRVIYFFRNSIRTLSEIRGAVETLKRQKRFMDALAKQLKELTQAFHDLAAKLEEAHKLIKRIRND